MTRLAHTLCAIYGATALFLAYATVQQALYGALWAVGALSVSSLVPLIALVREIVHSDTMLAARAMVDSAHDALDHVARPSLPRRTPGAEITVADALAAACCEVWWATAGAEHDPATCSKKGSSA
ncbi:hypothetical protein [Streptomyces sp. NPDC002265]|uniref:hypothetical protein n=1 Tax=Streptomyces sp. NPDC002265 TaxID=3154415 RepID=UPI00331A01FD